MLASALLFVLFDPSTNFTINKFKPVRMYRISAEFAHLKKKHLTIGYHLCLCDIVAVWP